MIEWKTDRPISNCIIAKLSPDFCHSDYGYAILYHCEYYDLRHPEGYYEDGEYIPYSAIEKWEEIN